MAESMTQTIAVPRLAAPAVPVALRALAGQFETFSMWCLALHLVYAALLFSDAAVLARQWLFPVVHFIAWAVLAGSHALVFVDPSAMHAPRARRHAHLRGRCFAILLGHEILHIAPLALLYGVAAAFPPARSLSLCELAAGTGGAFVLGWIYFRWQSGRSNVYGVTTQQLELMAVVAAVAGMLANTTAGLSLVHI